MLTARSLVEEGSRCVLSTGGVIGETSAVRWSHVPVKGGSGKARVASNGFATSCRS